MTNDDPNRHCKLWKKNLKFIEKKVYWKIRIRLKQGEIIEKV